MNEMYETPEIEITEVNVEKGFAITGETIEPGDEPE